MMRRLMLAGAIAAVMAGVLAGPAAAARPSRTLATPKASCTILLQYGATSYGSLGACMGNLHADVSAFRFPSDDDPNVLLSLSERCRQFESQFLTYPFTFEEGPEWPLPVLTAQNRNQCELTLYTYHELADALFGGET